MPDPNLEKLVKESYVAMIKNSPGTKMFNTFFVRDLKKNETFDVYENGHYSCAFFVTSVLTIFGLIDRPHSTVTTVQAKFLESEKWLEVKISDILSGDVLVWEKITWENEGDIEHIGFYVGGNEAVSTSWKLRKVQKHHFTYGENEKGEPVRKIIAAYRPLI